MAGSTASCQVHSAVIELAETPPAWLDVAHQPPASLFLDSQAMEPLAAYAFNQTGLVHAKSNRVNAEASTTSISRIQSLICSIMFMPLVSGERLKWGKRGKISKFLIRKVDIRR